MIVNISISIQTMKKMERWSLYCLFILLMFSCKTYDKVVYFQNDIPAGEQGTVLNNVKIQVGDFLSIVVFADDVEGAKQFNFPLDLVTVGGQIGGYTQGAPVTVGYSVDSHGNVNLPVIGKVKLQGLTLEEARILLTTYYENYLLNPVVNIQIRNFMVTILGDVKDPGTYQVPNERMTLVQLFGVAGDLNVTANRKNVLVLREVDGVKTSYRIDLTKTDLFSSPVFYLKQNDVVYVEPNFTKRLQNTVLASNLFGVIVSAISVTISILAFAR
jgi:polysaccharide export outer membrane protein